MLIQSFLNNILNVGLVTKSVYDVATDTAVWYSIVIKMCRSRSDGMNVMS